MDFGKVNLATEEFIEKIFKDVQSSGILKKERHLFATGITPIGHVDSSGGPVTLHFLLLLHLLPLLNI